MQLKNDAALARALGIKPSKLSVWKLRNYVSYKILTTYCSHNNLNLDWIINGKGPVSKPSSADHSFPYSTFSVLRRVPNEFPEEIPDEAVDYIHIPGEPGKPYALIVKCECVSALRNGDFIIFDRGAEVKNGDVVVVNDEWGETMLRRYCLKAGEIFLVSDNPECSTFKFTEDFKIIGKVVDAWRRISI